MSLNASLPYRPSRTAEEQSWKADRRVQSVARMIEDDPAQSIAVLARAISLSPSRLSHLFKRETGCSLHTFLAGRRLEQAALLLRHTNLPVKAVSYTVGYQHPPSLVRAFRKHFGCSPGEYRDRQPILLSSSRFG